MVWTVSHAFCPDYDQDTILYTYLDLPEADAGEDMTVCWPNVQLDALPSGDPVSGIWVSNPPGLQFSDPSDPFAEVSGIAPGNNNLTWTLSHPDCPSYSSDEMIINYQNAPLLAEDDLYTYSSDILNVNVLGNDQIPDTESIEITIIEHRNEEENETMVLEDNGNLIFYLPEPTVTLSRRFIYRIAYTDCPDIFDEAEVTIEFLDRGTSEGKEDIALVFTPNGDGINDTFIIPELEENPGSYPNNSLVVINRWGDVVYRAKPYENNWDGTHFKTGKPLPPGTYFYIARLHLANGLVQRERVTLIR